MPDTISLAIRTGSPRVRTFLRVGAAVFGGYAFTWGLVALATCGLFAAGLDFHDAEFLGAVVGLLGYLAVFVWAAATSRLACTWAVLLMGGALMAGLASYLKSLLA